MFARRRFFLFVYAAQALLACADALQAATLYVPNGSFESPAIPQVAPYAAPDMDSWQKSAQPDWYVPSQNADTPWTYLTGTFYNVPFPGQFIDDCDGAQAAFLFAVPQVSIFQDYDSVGGTNSVPSHAFNAAFVAGKAYALTVGILGGGGGMKPGATLQLSLYYRDASGNFVTVAALNVTNSGTAFPTNTHFVDYQVEVPGVKPRDPWVGKNIGIQLLSTTGFDLAGGYWDLDNVRLTETVAPELSIAEVANGRLVFTLLSEPGVQFAIEATTNLTSDAASWTSIRTVTNSTGAGSFTETVTSPGSRFYRARKL